MQKYAKLMSKYVQVGKNKSLKSMHQHASDSRYDAKSMPNYAKVCKSMQKYAKGCKSNLKCVKICKRKKKDEKVLKSGKKM